MSQVHNFSIQGVSAVHVCEHVCAVLCGVVWVLQTVRVMLQDDSYNYWMRQRSVIVSVHPSFPASLCAGRASLERGRRRNGSVFLEGIPEWQSPAEATVDACPFSEKCTMLAFVLLLLNSHKLWSKHKKMLTPTTTRCHNTTIKHGYTVFSIMISWQKHNNTQESNLKTILHTV